MGTDMAESRDDELTPEELASWLRLEVAAIAKATELRIAEATEFVTERALGRLTAREAQDRLLRYQDRWGDSPVPGVTVNEDMTNEQILKKLDDGLPADIRQASWWRPRQSSERSR
jgi:hypothetical protein